MPNASFVPLIGFGQVRHARLRPAVNRFGYGAYFLRLPLRALANTPWRSRLLGINRLAPMAVLDRDHGDGAATARMGGRPRSPTTASRTPRRALAAHLPARARATPSIRSASGTPTAATAALRAIVVRGEQHLRRAPLLPAGTRRRPPARLGRGGKRAQGVPRVAVLRDRRPLPLPLHADERRRFRASSAASTMTTSDGPLLQTSAVRRAAAASPTAQLLRALRRLSG